MASSRRRSDASLIEALRSEPERFSFLQAVRILERAAESGESPPAGVGADAHPREEPVWLRAALELAFPATEVAALETRDERTLLTVTLMGLNGPSGVLPSYYSELLIQAQRGRNRAMRDFFDVFNHRALSHFVRALEKYRIAPAFERAAEVGKGGISEILYALVGLDGPSLRHRQASADEIVAFYGGHYSKLNRSAGALGQLIADHFGLEAQVIQFQGRWGVLRREEQTRLSSAGESAYAQLGVDAVCGATVFDPQAAFRIRLGPLDYDQFLAFLPGGEAMARLRALARTYAGPTLGYEVQLVLRADQIPAASLDAQAAAPPRLGWNSWLPTSAARADAGDSVFDG